MVFFRNIRFIYGDGIDCRIVGLIAFKGNFNTLTNVFLKGAGWNMGFVLSKLVNRPVEKMEMIIRLAKLMLGEDFRTNARSLQNLGLQGMTTDEILRFAELGKTC